MVDTERTLAELLVIFEDGQGAGSISEQDVRDLIVSLVPAYGSMYVSTAIETAVAAQNTPLKALGTTTAGDALHHFTHAANRLTYTGTPDRDFTITVALSLTAAQNNQVLAFHIAKNGAVIAASEIQRKAATGADIGAASVMVEIDLSTNDYVELWVENKSADTNLTIEFMNFEIGGILV
jgi:hypothetical protein